MNYKIENEYLIAKVSTLGATLTNLIWKRYERDIVLGFDTKNEYLEKKGPYFGATVARCANRIKNGMYTLDNKTYNLTINNGPNTLHGGNGVSFKEFELVKYLDDEITLKTLMLDGEDGFNGNTVLEVTYKLVDNKLIYYINAKTDNKSILNVTNHSYFNLNDDDCNCLEHELKIYSDTVALNDDDGLALDTTINVRNTSFDFTEFKQIKQNLELNHLNLSNGGLDHNYVFETLDDKLIVELRNKDLNLKVKTNLPDVHIYTGNYIGDIKGKNNKDYHNYQGIAIEPQFYPNAINYDRYLKPIIEDEVNYYIEYIVEER